MYKVNNCFDLCNVIGRTHTDLRPYFCAHCEFAFKTKGNLTKHMKSKAHHKKCVELGIVPVPTHIDDSHVDLDQLAKQVCTFTDWTTTLLLILFLV